IKGVSSWIPKLSDNTSTLFTGDGTRRLLMYGIKAGSGDGKWAGNDPTYTYTVGTTSTTFTYDNTKGTFSCTAGSGKCNELVD
ncbi:MAG: prepilin-type cleavage/methylation domain-containing protein, partial [Epsilonproteobacteria bacterium]|nr:prepilin-type cleavage/methylation domain-containing protein [Campylobacterota bacterium]